MRSLTHSPIDDLRLAIDCLPLRTLVNLLEASLAAEVETDLGAAIAEYRASVPEILVRRLKPGRLRLGQRGELDDRTPSLSRANVSSPSVS